MTQLTQDIEDGLMEYCIEKKGKWWANSLFRNVEVDDLYKRLRQKSASEVARILVDHWDNADKKAWAQKP